MLENIQSLDLSGVTGQIYYSYDNMYAYLPSIIASIGIFILFLVVTICIANWLSGTKTRNYRRQLVDLYVSATIRKFAKEDNLDLEEEYKTFIKDRKKRKLETEGLSRVVEDELSEKVMDSQEKKLNKDKK